MTLTRQDACIVTAIDLNLLLLPVLSPPLSLLSLDTSDYGGYARASHTMSHTNALPRHNNSYQGRANAWRHPHCTRRVQPPLFLFERLADLSIRVGTGACPTCGQSGCRYRAQTDEYHFRARKLPLDGSLDKHSALVVLRKFVNERWSLALPKWRSLTVVPVEVSYITPVS